MDFAVADVQEQASLVRWPKYLRIKQDLTEKLRAGHFDPNAPLPSEKMLAELGGVSIGTVRQALSEMADEGLVRREQGRGTFVTGQTNNPPAQLLNVFALIAPQLREGVYPMLVHGFEEASAGLHHQVQVGNSQNDIGRQANLVLGLIDQMVGGVAVVPATSEPTPAVQIRQLQKNEIPVVFCHRSVEGISAPCVTFSGFEVGFRAGKALYELGHRRAGCLLDCRTSLANEYERGLTDAMRPNSAADNGIVTTIEYGITSTSERAREALQKTVLELLSGNDRPTAIFCGNVTDGEQVYLQAEAAGFKVPRDLSIMSFGSTWRGHGLSQRISGVVVDEHALGARAAALLHQMRRGERAFDSDERIEFPVTLYMGETLGPAAK